MKEQAQRWWKQGSEMVRQAEGRPEVFVEWVERLASHQAAESVPALWAFQQVGPQVIPTLVVGLQHPNARVRRNCVDIIDHGGYAADARCVAALLKALHDSVPRVRRQVWHTLFCERCPDPRQCEVPLEGALDRVGLLVQIGIHDPNPKLRRQLVAELVDHRADERAHLALEQLAASDDDLQTAALAQRVLA